MIDTTNVPNQSSSKIAGLWTTPVRNSLVAVIVSFVLAVLAACSRTNEANLFLVVLMFLVPIADLFLAVNISKASTNSNTIRWGVGVGVFLALLAIQWFAGLALVFLFGKGFF